MQTISKSNFTDGDNMDDEDEEEIFQQPKRSKQGIYFHLWKLE